MDIKENVEHGAKALVKSYTERMVEKLSKIPNVATYNLSEDQLVLDLEAFIQTLDLEEKVREELFSRFIANCEEYIRVYTEASKDV